MKNKPLNDNGVQCIVSAMIENAIFDLVALRLRGIIDERGTLTKGGIKRLKSFAKCGVATRTCDYNSAAQVNTLIDFFRPGQGFDAWVDMAQLGFCTVAARRKLFPKGIA